MGFFSPRTPSYFTHSFVSCVRGCLSLFSFRNHEFVLNLLAENGLFDNYSDSNTTNAAAKALGSKEKAEAQQGPSHNSTIPLSRKDVKALFENCSKNERDSLTLFNLIESLISLRSSPISLSDSSLKPKPKVNQAIKIDHGTHIATLHDLAFTFPLRKKMDLRICQNALTLTISAPAKTTSQSNSNTSAVQSLQAVDPIIIPLTTISQVICIPTPEKQKSHFTIVLIRTNKQKGKEGGDLEPAVFGFDETGTFLNSTHRVLEKLDPKQDFILQLLEKVLSVRNIAITKPLPSMFKLSSSNSKVPIHHIVAHVKAKEGFVSFVYISLYF
jgi:hypothetical protein